MTNATTTVNLGRCELRVERADVSVLAMTTRTRLMKTAPHHADRTDACVSEPWTYSRKSVRYPSDGPVMRLGVPHAKGRLTASIVEGGAPVMVSAAAFWDAKRRRFKDPWGPLAAADVALDSAGFTAIQQWQRHGAQPGAAGIYPWSVREYVELAEALNPNWWSAPDLCNEASVAHDAAVRRDRIARTAGLLHETLSEVVAAWSEGPTWLAPCVPVLQGWTVEEYRRSLDATLETWSRFHLYFDPPVLMGLGSVCRRDLHDRDHGLYAVVEGLLPYLPHYARLHLYGVKGAALRRLFGLSEIAGADSMAWDVAARRTAHKNGQSNSVASRLDHAQRWEAHHRATTDQIQTRLI